MKILVAGSREEIFSSYSMSFYSNHMKHLNKDGFGLTQPYLKDEVIQLRKRNNNIDLNTELKGLSPKVNSPVPLITSISQTQATVGESPLKFLEVILIQITSSLQSGIDTCFFTI